MSYEVVARRWRPLNFSTVVGQSHVTTTLANAIERGRVPHAFLFTGIRGVGKTTVARLLARALNCSDRKGAEPCNACPACTQGISGSSVDVIEIDGASNTGIDDIRAIIEAAQYRPAMGDYRVYIIDEVHQLSKAAFQGLLKTLEEPPDHVKFIMATTEWQKVPPTVLSRCQRYDFRRLSDLEIREQLGLIAQKDGLEVTPDAIALLAREADGSMRDAQSLLEQVLAGADGSADAEKVAELLGIAGQDLIRGFVEAVVRRQPENIVELYVRVRRYGYDPEKLLGGVMDVMRDLTVAVAAGMDALGEDVPPENLDLIEQLRGEREALDLHRIFEVLIAAGGDLRRGGQPDLTLEMSFLKAASLEKVSAAAEILDRLRGIVRAEAGGGAGPGGSGGSGPGAGGSSAGASGGGPSAGGSSGGRARGASAAAPSSTTGASTSKASAANAAAGKAVTTKAAASTIPDTTGSTPSIPTAKPAPSKAAAPKPAPKVESAKRAESKKASARPASDRSTYADDMPPMDDRVGPPPDYDSLADDMPPMPPALGEPLPTDAYASPGSGTPSTTSPSGRTEPSHAAKAVNGNSNGTASKSASPTASGSESGAANGAATGTAKSSAKGAPAKGNSETGTTTKSTSTNSTPANGAPANGTSTNPTAPSAFDEENHEWEEFLDVVRSRHGLDLYVLLTNCEVLAMTPELLELRPMVPEFAKRLANPKVSGRVGDMAKAQLGPRAEVRILPVDENAIGTDGVSLRGIEDDRIARKQAEALRDPIVGWAIEELGGKVTQISILED